MHRVRLLGRTVLSLTMLLVIAPAASAQKVPRPDDGARSSSRLAPGPTIGWSGASLGVALPVGQFANYVNLGGGLNAFAALKLARDGAASIRTDLSFLLYGSETRHTPLSNTVQLVNVDVTTQNTIFSFGIGPQLTATRGAIRPYAVGQVGFSYFATVSSVSGSGDVETFASSTNFDDVTFALRGGGGLWIRLSPAVALDLSAHFINNGRVQYLREGSITFDATGAPIYHPIESETNLWIVHAGVSVGIQPRR